MIFHDAYNLVVQKIIELRDSGIDVYTKHPFITANINHSADYEITDELPEELWNHVTFRSVSNEQMQQIFDAREYLLKSGIYFDSATFIAAERPSPEWQIDWSFTLLDFEENSSEQ
jgi:hypothetical protein